MKKLVACLALSALALLCGCQSASSFADKLAALEKLGIKEVEVTGKFSHTKFTKVKADGKVTTTLDHNNTWVPLVRVVREVPE